MKKILVSSLALAFLLVGFQAQAKNPKSPADYNGLNKGTPAVNHLYLYEKNPSDWSIVTDGAWGKMTYKEDSYVFNGHGLVPGEKYSLVYYPDPWPGTGLEVLGAGTANSGGNVHISSDDFDFTSIPIGSDTNPGAKIWLVLSSDTDGSQMTGWNPTEYLFEYNLINMVAPI